MSENYNDIHTMKDGKTLSKKAYKSTTKMPVAKSFDEFGELLLDFLAANKVEFALYVSSIGVLPKGENNPFSMFSNQDAPDADVQFARMAAMFYSLCENMKLNTKEELEKFASAVALAAMRCGDKSFNEG